MKKSKYNICLPFEGKHIIFNGVTKRFFMVSNQNKEAFLQILSDPDEYTDSYGPFLQRMKDEGFIVEDSIDEFGVVQQQYETLREGKVYQLMILPTYNCNVRCWYCTQHHKNIRLTTDDVQRIKNHISFYLSHHDIDGLRIMWFGGEPLLGFRQIDDISSFSKTLCEEKHLFFSCSITTNGILLTEKILRKMKELNFTFFQIAIDGIQEEHDKVKVMQGKSAYAQTLQNICLITKILPEARINLRYNYTMKNLKPDAFMDDLNRHIPPEVRKHIILSLMKVWQEDELNISDDDLDRLANLASSSGYTVRVGPGFSICYVEDKHFNCVFPNGKMGKCDNIAPDECKGIIEETGEIIWEKENAFETNTVFNDSESDCIQCKYLPLCYGPCPKERDVAFENQRPLRCKYKHVDKTWTQRIIYYCKGYIKND